MGRVKRKLEKGVALAILFLLGAGGFEASSQPVGEAQGYLVRGTHGNENAAVAQAAGEFRIVAANLLWAKVVDHYHHQYLATGGDWSKNQSLLPLLRTITVLDPHFVQAYEIEGGSILPRIGRIGEGRAVLDRAIQSNPNEWELYRERAMLDAWYAHEPARALPYARAGLAQANDDFSRHLMTLLCHTLQKQAREQRKA